MAINPLSSNIINLISPEPVMSASRISEVNNDGVGGFSNILSESMRNAVEMEAADRASTVELLTGQADDLSGLMLDMQKAELSLNLTLQIRNRVIDAYNEIMRMQV